MNLSLTDPKLIALAAVVILVIAALAWMYVRKRRSMTAGLRQKFGPECLGSAGNGEAAFPVSVDSAPSGRGFSRHRGSIVR